MVPELVQPLAERYLATSLQLPFILSKRILTISEGMVGNNCCSFILFSSRVDTGLYLEEAGMVTGDDTRKPLGAPRFSSSIILLFLEEGMEVFSGRLFSNLVLNLR